MSKAKHILTTDIENHNSVPNAIYAEKATKDDEFNLHLANHTGNSTVPLRKADDLIPISEVASGNVFDTQIAGNRFNLSGRGMENLYAYTGVTDPSLGLLNTNVCQVDTMGVFIPAALRNSNPGAHTQDVVDLLAKMGRTGYDADNGAPFAIQRYGKRNSSSVYLVSNYSYGSLKTFASWIKVMPGEDLRIASWRYKDWWVDGVKQGYSSYPIPADGQWHHFCHTMDGTPVGYPYVYMHITDTARVTVALPYWGTMSRQIRPEEHTCPLT